MQYSIAGGSILLIFKNSTRIKKRWQINRYAKNVFLQLHLHSKFQLNYQVSQLSTYSIIRT